MKLIVLVSIHLLKRRKTLMKLIEPVSMVLSREISMKLIELDLVHLLKKMMDIIKKIKNKIENFCL
ncbi:hypothetical protein O3M35_012764 [Rhynocoris fuscipes]|uniref:Uncharacterized protein n=1 Tax=Rhynocoris fuscipes TaxID=488301 RepID=A0AAW1CTI7_9HEMI